jgi:hypothetical protein
MRKFAVLFVSVLAFGAFAMAQMEPKPLEVPKTEFFIGYSYQHADTSGSSSIVSGTDVKSTNLNGFAFEFSHYLRNKNLGFTVDISRGSNKAVDSTGINYVRTSYLAGPSYRIHNSGFFTANVHALAGIDRSDFTVPHTNTNIDYTSGDFAAAAGVTFDGNLSRHLGVRLAQVDYLYTHHYGTNQGSFRYTGGVVARF